LGVIALWAAFAWGFAEGSFFFVVPDVLLTLVALFSARDGFLACAATLAGELIAGALLYALAARHPAALRRFVDRVPFVRPFMWPHVRDDFEKLGWLAIRKGPMRGIPYKLYAVEAPRHLSASVFLLASIPGRLERFLLLTAVASLPGWAFHNWIHRHPAIAIAIHLSLWTAFYARYWSALSARRFTAG
jgi:membrane protein YqaA with SNARE-associated domain